MSRVRGWQQPIQAKELLVEMPYSGNELGVFGHPSKAGVASECGRGTPAGVKEHVWGFIAKERVVGFCPNARGRPWWVF